MEARSGQVGLALLAGRATLGATGRKAVPQSCTEDYPGKPGCRLPKNLIPKNGLHPRLPHAIRAAHQSLVFHDSANGERQAHNADDRPEKAARARQIKAFHA